MEVKWILDRYLLERSTPENGVTFVDALHAIGCETVVVGFDPRTRRTDVEIPQWTDQCVVAYGSIPLLRQLSKERPGWAPGSYFRPKSVDYASIGGHIGHLLLNEDFTILPFGEARRRGHGGRALFIRPESATKSFTGFSVAPDMFEFEMKCLETQSHVSPSELVVLAQAREIVSEARFVIVDGKVVAWSTYSFDDRAVPSAAVDPRCAAVAREVATNSWQPDTAYVCDVALAVVAGLEVAKVVELNSFSAAGLYACDTATVALAVTRAAWSEHAGID
jgi:hypothetical protein